MFSGAGTGAGTGADASEAEARGVRCETLKRGATITEDCLVARKAVVRRLRVVAGRDERAFEGREAGLGRRAGMKAATMAIGRSWEREAGSVLFGEEIGEENCKGRDCKSGGGEEWEALNLKVLVEARVRVELRWPQRRRIFCLFS